jgi:hypothetical protein
LVSWENYVVIIIHEKPSIFDRQISWLHKKLYQTGLQYSCWELTFRCKTKCTKEWKPQVSPNILYYIFFVLIPIYFTFRNQTKEFLIWTILEVQFSGEPIVNKFNWWIQLPRMYLIFFLIAINFAFMNQTKEILIWVAHEVQFTK